LVSAQRPNETRAAASGEALRPLSTGARRRVRKVNARDMLLVQEILVLLHSNRAAEHDLLAVDLRRESQ
jgi:hypothetical protein